MKNIDVTGMNTLKDGTLILPTTGEAKSFVMSSEQKDPLTKQQMLERINLLSSEIDANEEENRYMQNEINSLYARIDAL